MAATSTERDSLRRVSNAIEEAADAVDRVLARVFVLAAVVAVLSGLAAGYASAAPAGEVEMRRMASIEVGDAPASGSTIVLGRTGGLE